MEFREPGVGATRSPKLLKYAPEKQTESREMSCRRVGFDGNFHR